MASNQNKESFLYARDPSVDRRFRPCPNRKVALFNETLYEEEDDTESKSKSDDSGTAEKVIDTAANVYLRLRASSKLNNIYKTEGNIFKVTPLEINASLNHPLNNKDISEKQYKFSRIFGENNKQEDIYNSCVYQSIENGDNLTVLTYGTSGSGKTYTLLGDNSNPGIVIRSIEQLFSKYAHNICEKPILKVHRGNMVILNDEDINYEFKFRHKHFNKKYITNNYNGSTNNNINIDYEKMKNNINAEHKFPIDIKTNQNVVIWISFAEIYNENIYDLLDTHINNKENLPTGCGEQLKKTRPNLKIILNDGHSFIKDLTSVFVRNSQEACELLVNGLSHVNYALTNINEHSSRSHCIYFIDVIVSEPTLCTHISYKFCDLAGSERLKKTENIGNRLKEAQRINNSLMVLGRCLDSLYTNQQHQQQQKKNNNNDRTDDYIVPIRDSKLTMLLQAPLLGNEKLTMIVNLYPTIEFYEENMNVLNFSAIAKQIKYKKSKPQKRSTRFSCFIIQAITTSSPTHNNSTTDISILLEENYRLRAENDQCREHVLELQRQMVKQEDTIKEELSTEFQKQLSEIYFMYNNRIDQLIQRHEKAITQLKEDHAYELENAIGDSQVEIISDDSVID